MSSTTTLTRTSSSSEHMISMTLNWRPLNYQEARDELIEILDRYETWNDPFSQRLFRWGVEILPAHLPDDYVPNEEEVAYGAQKIEELRKQILISPLDRAPLREPVLEREWLWERWQLEDFQTLYHLSPFDGMPFEEIRRHRFAEELLYWLQSLAENRSPSLGESSSSGELIEMSRSYHLNASLIQQSNDDQSKVLKMFTYMNLARNANLERGLREGIRYPIEEASVIQGNLLVETKKLIKAERRLSEAKERAREEWLQGELTTRDQVHTSERTILKDQLDDTSRRLTNTEKRAEKAEVTCTQLEISNAALTRDRDAQRAEVQRLQHDLRCKQEHDRVECRIL